MALVSVDPIALDPSSRSLTQDDKGYYSATRQYVVVVDDEEDTELEVAAWFSAETEIVKGTQYAEGIASYVSNLSLQYGEEGSKQWTVTVQYTPFGAYETPFDEPPQIEWTADPRERPLDIDSEGNLVVNTAYDPFDPTLTTDDALGRLTVTVNVQGLDWRYPILYSNKINATWFLGWEPRTVKMGLITFSLLYDNEFGWYKRVTFPLYFKPDGWDAQVVNLGRRKLVDGVRKPILDNGVPVSEPVKLDEAGLPLDPDAPPVILTYKPYEAVDFAIYGLDGILPYLLGGVF